jgi:thiamine pyrophosphokinase
MHPSPQHEDVLRSLARSLPQRSTPALRDHDISIPSSESQNSDDLELAVELIELRYQDHCARMELEVLIVEGGIGVGCL